MNTRNLSVMMVLVIGLSAFAGGASAAFDTETTVTSTTSDLTGSNDFVTLPADSTAEAVYIEVDNGTSDGVAKFYSDDDGDGVAESNELIYTDSTATATNDTEGHYAFEATGADLENLEVQDGKILNNLIVEIDEDNDGTVETSTTANVDAISTDRTHIRFSQAAADDSRVTIANNSGFLGLGDEVQSASVEEDAAIDGTSTDVQIQLADSEIGDTLTAATTDQTSGDTAYDVVVLANNQPVPVFVQSAPDSFDGNVTYATVDAASGDVSLVPGEDYSDASSVNVKIFTNDNLGFGDAYSVYGFGEMFAAAGL